MLSQMLKASAIAVLLATSFSVAQDSPPKPVGYRLEYTLIEMDGAKKVSSRTYTLLVEEKKRASTRVGSRVPYATGSFSSGVASAPASVQYNYAEVGVNLDATVTVLDSVNVRLDTTAEVNSLVAQESGGIHAPVIRSCRDSITTIVPLDRTVTLTTQDDPSNNSSLQIQVLVKLVK
jgi:type II secretory pathway component GspD/PulD (secretin)